VNTFLLSRFAPPLVVPYLEAGPVVLRPFSSGDLSLIEAAGSDPYIPSMTSVPRHFSESEGRAYLARQSHQAEDGHGFPFVIAPANEPERGIGGLGLWLREIDSGRASIGYWLVPSARGMGMAAAALGGVVQFAFGSLAIPRLHLFIEPWNVASQRTAEAAGFANEGLLRAWERIDGRQCDALAFVRLHQEWSDAQR